MFKRVFLQFKLRCFFVIRGANAHDEDASLNSPPQPHDLGAEFVGEVVADFLGITDSRYQFVVDAYARHVREVNRERRRKRLARQRRRAEEALVISSMEGGARPREQEDEAVKEERELDQETTVEESVVSSEEP